MTQTPEQTTEQTPEQEFNASIRRLHCVSCGQQGTLTLQPGVLRAWINYEDEETNGSDWVTGPDVAPVKCGGCGHQTYVEGRVPEVDEPEREDSDTPDN